MSPAYGATPSLPIFAVYPGDPGVAVFSAEAVTVGEYSQRVCIAKPQNAAQANIFVELIFSAAPGTFEFDVYEALTDALADYTFNPANILSSVASSQGGLVATLQFPTNAKFILLYVNALANAATITVTAKIFQR